MLTGMPGDTTPLPKVQVRRDSGLYGYERALKRVGLAPVAGADEAGRGACAGPLVAGAVILSDAKSKQISGLRDSKLLSAAQRERCYEDILNKALAWSVVSIEPGECDRLGMHVANVEALRRALLRLDLPPTYVLTDGFSVDGLGVPGLSIWKGDQVAACVAAASVIAKVTRDRMMTEIDGDYPEYEFALHKGYCTPEHQKHLDRLGPSPTHRMRFENVSRTVGAADAEHGTVTGDITTGPDGNDADGIGRPSPERPRPERPSPERPSFERPSPERRSPERGETT